MSRDSFSAAPVRNQGEENAAKADQAPPKSARRLGRYRLIAEIGRGGMANVYLAVLHGQMGFNKLVVIKCMKPELLEDSANIQMFLDEARLAAVLNHPNIVQTHEVGEEGGQLYLVMEYLPGQPLHIIRRRAQSLKQPFSLPLFSKVLADALFGLHYAHDLKKYDGTPLHLVHRDISPQNIFVTYDGVVKVVDFGIAKVSGRSTETATGIVKGKVAYMAPEQVMGEVDRRTDIFCAGIMLWEAATDKRMWSGEEDMRILHKLSQGKWVSSPKAVNPEVPDAIDKICQKALAVDVNERYQTAAEFRRDLQNYLENLSERLNENDVSTFMNSLFKDERDKIFAAIEEQFSKIESASTGNHVPLATFRPPFTTTATGSLELPTGASKILRGLGQELGDASETRTSVARDTQTLTNRPAGRSEKKTKAWVALGVTAVTLGGGLYFVQNRTGSAGITTASSAINPVSSSPPAPVESYIRITTQPENASIYVGDQGPFASPYSGQMLRTSPPQAVRVEAKGYVSFTKDVTLDKDVSLAVTLEPDEQAAASAKVKPRGGSVAPRGAKPVASSPTSPAPGQGDAATTATKNKRSIDKEVPF